MKIRFRKRTMVECILGGIVVVPFLFAFMQEFLGFPHAIKYILDLLWCFLTVIMVVYYQRLDTKNVDVMILWILLFAFYCFMGYLVQYQSPLYYLWGLRNNFRYYVALIAFSVFLTSRDIEGFFGLFDKVFWLNAFVSLIQFFCFGFEGDYLGGLFGVEKGANGCTNIFFAIVVANSILRYLEKKESAKVCAIKCIAALYIAALAELKFFFVEFALIVALTSLFTDFSWRKLGVIVGGIAGILVFASVLVMIFPNFAGFLSWDWLLEAAISDRGYTSSGDLNRLNAISVINDRWLTTWPERIFGLGLGNCDTSTFTFLNTPFFERYGDMHYTWLSYALMYLECGWIGLIFYFGFFALAYYKVHKIEKRSTGDAVTYCRLARIMAILWMIISVYNSSLRYEAGYMAYFVLAIPFVFDREARLEKMRR